MQTLFTKAVESEELMGYFHTKNGYVITLDNIKVTILILDKPKVIPLDDAVNASWDSFFNYHS